MDFPRNGIIRVIGGLLRVFYVLWALRVVGTFFHCIFHSLAVALRNDTRRCTEAQLFLLSENECSSL